MDMGHIDWYQTARNPNIHDYLDQSPWWYGDDPDSKVQGANIGPVRGRQGPGGPREPCYLYEPLLSLNDILCSFCVFIP